MRNHLKLMYITNSPQVAIIAEKYGVDRIWIDLETLGKEERQKNRDTVKSKHTINDIKKIAPLLTTSSLLVRINPWNNNSINEIEKVINAGADIIMLPMWRSVDEVRSFLTAVDDRVHTILLLETKEAENCLDSVLGIDKVEEIHIGLNDLHISYGKIFMFELLADGTVDRICNKLSRAGVKFGFGGISKIGDGILPAENIVLEHYRLGSSSVILSRSFCNTAQINDINKIDEIFRENIQALRNYEDSLFSTTVTDFKKNHDKVIDYVENIVASMTHGDKNE